MTEQDAPPTDPADPAADRSGVKVLARAAAVLRLLRDEPGGMSLGRIAQRIGLPRSTVQRIVGALQDERMVVAAQAGGGLVLGPEMRRLGAASRFDVAASCRIVLLETTAATGETTDLSVMREGGMILIDQVEGGARLRTVTPVGEVFPLTTTANGRACLALLTDAEALAITAPERAAAGRDRSGAGLLALLAETRRTGLAYDLDDHTEGICAVGVAFRDPSGEVCAISAPVPRVRFAARRRAVENALVKARAAVEQMLAPAAE